MGANDRPADGDSQYYEVKEEADDAQRRARRLELIVYASLVAFVVLAVYGFWLITSLTRDVSQLTEEISSMTRVVDRDMSAIVRHMEAMEGRMVDIAGSTAEMEQSVASISEDTGRMSTDIGSMTRDTEVMAGSVIGMQRDMWSLNRNVGGPMGMMNMFNPLSGQGGPYPGSGGPYRPPSAPR